VSWRRFFERRRRDEDFARELEAHLALEIDELVARGVPRDEARARAARKLGNRTSLREAAYEHNSVLSLEALLRDLRYGLRQLRRNPLFTTVAVLSLALGIGANAAVFSLIDQTAWRPLPIDEPEKLVLLHQPGPLSGHSSTDGPDGPSFSYPMLKGLQRRQTPFAGLAGSRPTIVTVSNRGEGTVATAHRVSGNYFDVLGLRPAVGRLLTEQDDVTPGAHPVVVLGHHYWARHFDADRAVVGRDLVVNGIHLTIVGVAPRGFFGERHGSAAPELFVPLSMNREMEPGWNGFEDRHEHWIELMARLKAGVTAGQARREINAAYRAELLEDIATLGHGTDEDFRRRYRAKEIVLKPGGRGRHTGSSYDETRRRLLALPAITLLVLLIACANIAALMLTRTDARNREIFVRRSLGAPRSALVRQVLVECTLIAAAGCGLGLIVASWMLPLLAAHLSTAPVGPLSMTLDRRVVAAGLVLSAGTVLVFGVYPALRAAAPEIGASLRAESTQLTATRGARFFRAALVSGQLAISLFLLIAAGLFTKTLVNLRGIDLGFAVDGLVAFQVEPELNRYSKEQAAAFYARVRERVASMPGVQQVSMTTWRVVAGSRSGSTVALEERPEGLAEGPRCAYTMVDADYLRTLRIPLRAGRTFLPEELSGEPSVAIVSEAFARAVFGEQSPLGRRFLASHSRQPIEVVGVAGDGKYSFLREDRERFYYLPLGPRTKWQGRVFYLRTSVPVEPLAPRIRHEVGALDPLVPVRRLRPVRAQIEQSVANERAFSILSSCMAGIATLLAAIGLYGTLAHAVARRTREIGIRVTLGATVPDVRRLLGRDVAWLFAVGGGLGLIAAAWLTRLARALLYEVQPWDPAIYSWAVFVLGAVTLLAMLGPARQATRIDPILALRQD